MICLILLMFDLLIKYSVLQNIPISMQNGRWGFCSSSNALLMDNDSKYFFF